VRDIVEKNGKSCFLLILLNFRRVLKIAKSDISFVMSVPPTVRNHSLPTGRILVKFGI